MKQNTFKRELKKAFISGLASFMVIWPQPLKLPNVAGRRQDAKQIQKDWENVGKSLKTLVGAAATLVFIFISGRYQGSDKDGDK